MQKNTHVRNNKVTEMSNEKEDVDFLVRMVIVRANRRTYRFANQFWLIKFKSSKSMTRELKSSLVPKSSHQQVTLENFHFH